MTPASLLRPMSMTGPSEGAAMASALATPRVVWGSLRRVSSWATGGSVGAGSSTKPTVSKAACRRRREPPVMNTRMLSSGYEAGSPSALWMMDGNSSSTSSTAVVLVLPLSV